MTHKNRMRWLLFILVTLAISRPLRAQELSFGWGALDTPDAAEKTTYNWQIEYRHNFLKRLSWSAAWINEGHFEDHHRDGFASQLWYRLPLSPKRSFSLDFGIGADRYFDTQPDGQGGSLDVHGWAPIYSVSATWYTKSPLLFRATYNRIDPANDIATNGIQMVVGYKLWKTSEDEAMGTSVTPETPDRTTGNEFTAFVGKTVVNTFNSESGVATGLEFRKGVWKYCDWTFSWINEGNPQVIRRNGLASQAWLVDDFLNRRLAIGMGAGAYFYVDRKQEPVAGQDAQGSFAPLIGPTIAWRISDRWLARLNWNRVISSYNKDSDVFLLGIGYRWDPH